MQFGPRHMSMMRIHLLLRSQMPLAQNVCSCCVASTLFDAKEMR